MTLSKKQCSSCGLEVEPTINVCPRDGTTIDNPFQSDPIFQEKYEFLESIGAGGMGVIYKARHLILNKIIAIKMVHSHLVSPQAIQRFQIEGKAASSLSHPNIIAVTDFGTTQSGQPYMVMDYLTGKSLSQVLAREGHLDMKRFLKIFLQASDALAHAHAHGVVHRDIKPANIMLVPGEHAQEEVRIMDFGLAKIVDDTEYAARHLTKTGVAMGSPYYMSPEQAKGTKVDHRSDLYSLGCTMYETLTGSPPFEGKTPFETMLMHLNDAPASLKEASLGTDFDPRIEKIVAQLLEKGLDFRYQSMDELHADLLIVEADESWADVPNSSRRQIFRGALICVAVVGALLFAAIKFPTWLSSHRTHPLATSAGEQAASPPAPKLAQSDSSQSPVTAKVERAKPAPPANIKQSDEDQMRSLIDKELNETARDIVAEKVRKRGVTLDLSKAHFPAPMKDEDLRPVSDAFTVADLSLKNEPIHDQGLECLRNLRLKKLDLESTYVASLQPISNQTDLLELYVKNTNLDSQGMETIGRFHNLKRLSLATTAICDSDLCSLYGLQSLQILDLSSCSKLTQGAVDRLKEHLPKNCAVSFVAVTKVSDNLSYAQGMDYLTTQEPMKACTKFQQAAKELKDSPNQALLAECLWRSGTCKYVRHEYPIACTLYDSAIQLMNKVEPDSEVLGTAYINFSEAQQKQDNLKAAISLRESADKVFKRVTVKPERKIAVQELESRNLFALSGLYAQSKEQEKAIEAMDEGLSVAKTARLDLSDLEASCTERIAQISFEKGKCPEALDYYQRTLNYYRSHPSPIAHSKISGLQLQIARAEGVLGRSADASASSGGNH